MHRYDWEPEKYMVDTAHLDEIEDLVYRRLLDYAYLLETPLPNNIADITKKIRLGKNRIDTVSAVLHEFFYLKKYAENDIEKDGWAHKKVELVLEKIYQRSDKARESANAKWAKWYRANPANAERTQSERRANAMQTQCDGSANALLIQVLKYPKTQILKDKDKNNGDTVSSPSGDSPPQQQKLFPETQRTLIPYDEIVNEYNRICISLRKCRPHLSDVRKKGVAKIYRLLDNDMDQIRLLFTKAQNSAFCRGERPNEKHPNFQADFAWLMKEEPALRTLEGKYDDKNPYDSVDEFGESKMEEEDDRHHE